MKRGIVVCVILVAVAFAACKKDADQSTMPMAEGLEPFPSLPQVPFEYADLNLPPHVAGNTQLNVYDANNNPGFNPTTNDGATLGRVLFYDKKLSLDNTISCGSCHFQENAFADPSRFSQGIDGIETPRNSMGLFNLRYSRDFFWDMRADGLEEQVLEPIEHVEEMRSDLDELAVELAETNYYPSLFEAAFGDSLVSAERISYAMSQFLRSMVSFNAKYDAGVASNYANFSEQELHGKDVFFSAETRCGQCHNSYNFFTRLEPAFNGLETQVVDSGFYFKTGNPDHIGMFKIAGLRNIELTAPYMHDGRFQTLEEVVEHYNSGVQPRPNLDERLTTTLDMGGPPVQMNLTEEDKTALIAFLKTLTDYTAIADERFADPFQ